MLPRHRQQLCHHKLHQRLIGPHSYAVTAENADALQLQDVTYFTWPRDSQKSPSQKDTCRVCREQLGQACRQGEARPCGA